jgi:SAM-dependent methyltransferase
MLSMGDPHAVLDDASRVMKASKIVAQLRAARSLEGTSVLDVGCGNGVIARELARAVGPSGSVFGVDVVDQRTTFDGYQFERVSGTILPFADSSFDIVVSNHCIEHVGDRRDQLHHLVEAQRVLRPGGICYLAVPNRWTLVEPHFRLPFLSWLPSTLRNSYVRLAQRGAHYDCDIPPGRELLRLICGAGFDYLEITIGAFPLIIEIEKPKRLKRALLRTPPRLATIFRPLLPTRIYILRKRSPRARLAL